MIHQIAIEARAELSPLGRGLQPHARFGAIPAYGAARLVPRASIVWYPSEQAEVSVVAFDAAPRVEQAMSMRQ
jgi:hypothetical protein